MKDLAMSFHYADFPTYRPRRRRRTAAIRDLVRETVVTPRDLVLPIFVIDGESIEQPIHGLPGVSRWTIDGAVTLARGAQALGIPAIIVFPCVAEAGKSIDCSEAWRPANLANRAIAELKDRLPDLCVMADVALDPYNTLGHDGIVRDGVVVNDESVDALVRQSLSLAQAGADILGPSDMMDGRIGRIRQALDGEGRQDTLLLSYAAKYASAYYGPFRNAVGTSQALTGDKTTYQLDIGNANEALEMVGRDLREGADMVMVKPGTPYLDICRRVKTRFGAPTFAYQVSGEYAMIRAAAANGWLEEDLALMETMIAFKRAGCDGILTYAATRLAQLLAQ